MGEWSSSYGSQATKRKVFIAKGLKYFDEVKAAEFLVESQSLSVGDEVVITGPTTGVIQTTIKELRVNDSKTETVNRGDVFTILLDEKIRPSDKLYKMQIS